jgi:hypothetical protein
MIVMTFNIKLRGFETRYELFYGFYIIAYLSFHGQQMHVEASSASNQILIPYSGT